MPLESPNTPTPQPLASRVTIKIPCFKIRLFRARKSAYVRFRPLSSAFVRLSGKIFLCFGCAGSVEPGRIRHSKFDVGCSMFSGFFASGRTQSHLVAPKILNQALTSGQKETVFATAASPILHHSPAPFSANPTKSHQIKPRIYSDHLGFGFRSSMLVVRCFPAFSPPVALSRTKKTWSYGPSHWSKKERIPAPQSAIGNPQSEITFT